MVAAHAADLALDEVGVDRFGGQFQQLGALGRAALAGIEPRQRLLDLFARPPERGCLLRRDLDLQRGRPRAGPREASRIEREA